MSASTATDEEKAYALALYSEHGPAEASRRTGINESTIKSWARRNGVAPVALENRRAAVEAKRVSVAQRKLDLARNLLGDIERLRGQLFARCVAHHWDKDGGFHEHELGEPTFGDKKALATSLAILVDKVQLLTGEATSRTESVTVDAVDAEIAKLRAEMDKADV